MAHLTGARPRRATPSDALTAEATELLQQLIRNACVNDGRRESGGEQGNAETIAACLAGAGMELERYACVPGRDSLVVRIEGSDPAAPTLCLMDHTDVAPPTRSTGARHPSAASSSRAKSRGAAVVAACNDRLPPRGHGA